MSVFLTPLGPILVLWIGAVVLDITDRFLDPQDRGVAETLVLLLSIGFLLGTFSWIDQPTFLGEFWSPAGWTGVMPFVVVGRASWLLALLLLCGVCAASVASMGRSTADRGGRLAALGAALLLLFAGDWSTLALAWLLVDLALIYALGRGRSRPSSIGWTSVLSVFGALLFGAAILLWHQADGSIWVDRVGSLPVVATAADRIPPHVGVWMVVALFLRTMPFPLPLWQDALPDPYQARPIQQAVVFVLPILLASYVAARLAQWGAIEQGGGWLTVCSLLAGVSMLVGAIRAWAAKSPGELVACISMYGGASVLLAVGLNLAPVRQLLVSMNAVLGILPLLLAWPQGQYLDLGDPRTYWRIAPAGLAFLSLVGMPLTVGFPARASVYWQIFEDQRWFVLLLVMVAQALLFAAFLRALFEVQGSPGEAGQEELPLPAVLSNDQPSAPDEGAMPVPDPDRAPPAWLMRFEHWVRHVWMPWWQGRNWSSELPYGAALFLGVGIVLLGVAPGLLHIDGVQEGLGRWFGLPTLPVWAAMSLSVVGGVALYRQQDVLVALVEGWWPLLRYVTHLGWLYRGVKDVFYRQLSTLIWSISRVIEGDGYMAWVVLACLVILLFVIAR